MLLINNQDDFSTTDKQGKKQNPNRYVYLYSIVYQSLNNVINILTAVIQSTKKGNNYVTQITLS